MFVNFIQFLRFSHINLVSTLLTTLIKVETFTRFMFLLDVSGMKLLLAPLRMGETVPDVSSRLRSDLPSFHPQVQLFPGFFRGS